MQQKEKVRTRVQSLNRFVFCGLLSSLAEPISFVKETNQLVRNFHRFSHVS